jgi:signal transduction histidine kinase
MKLGRLAAGAGVVAGVTLAYATHLYIFHTLRHQPTTFFTQVLEALAHVVGWMVLAPLLLRATARPPRDAAGWVRAAPRHLAAAVLIALAQIAVRTVVDETFTHRRSPLADFGDAFTALFTRTFYANILLYTAVLGARAFLRAYADRRVRAAELETLYAESQLEALRGRLHPHFLFNALNSALALIRSDPVAAESMLLRFSELLRNAVDRSRRHEIRLAEELDLVRHYLAIESIRYQDRLRFTIDVDEETAAALVPPFLLQPLVENAIRHGFNGGGGASTLTVSARRRGDALEIHVADDGAGLAGAPIEGVGLAATRARLEHMYGARHLFELRNRSLGGAEALVQIPFRTAGVGGVRSAPQLEERARIHSARAKDA